MEEQERLAELFGVQGVDKHDKYLGVPVEVSYSEEAAFGYLVERVKQRTEGWREKLLSAAGKEIMIKAVTQAIPTYVMNCFELPKFLCEDMHSLMARFWWGDTEDNNKIHWLSWDKLCAAKREGGLGFKDMHAYNLALLAKQGWRIMQHPDNLLSRVLKAKYFPRSSFMRAELEARASYTWRSIMAGRQVLEKGLRFQVGNGADISVWYDKWIPIPYSFKPFSESMEGLESLRVADLIDPDERVWQIPLLQELFTEHEVESIAKIPLSLRNPCDRLVWHFDKSGRYNVRSGYWAWKAICAAPSHASSSSSIVGGQLAKYLNSLWKLHMPAKIKVFSWRLLRDIIPTRVALVHRHVHIREVECVLCGVAAETSVHLFKNCSVVKEFWRSGTLKNVIPFVSNVCLTEWIWWVMDTLDKEQVHERVGVKRRRGQMKWECPLIGRLKINIYGAFNGSLGSGGIGVVVRDETGLGIAAMARPFKHAHSALNMEFEVCRAGLRLGIHQGWSDIDIESDSILLIAALERKEVDMSEVGHVLGDCKDYLRAFQSVRIRHIYREANGVADRLAHIASLGAFDDVWLEETHAIIHDIF